MINKILDLVQLYATLNSGEIEFFKKHIHVKSFAKNEVIFSAGKISKIIYFMIKGCVRLYYNVNGNEKTAFFYTEGKFICAGESYTFNLPAKENYQAIEDTELICLDKNTIDKLLNFSPNFEVMARIAVEDELITSQRIIASFVTKSPEERYLELLENNRELFLRAPQQYIASFLGVSPETLSRIKRRVVEKSKGSFS